jgi:alkylation response protein AidB-like acyl-CoA dehydrogenase
VGEGRPDAARRLQADGWARDARDGDSEKYGGAGMPDYRYNVVLQEEAAQALVTLSTVRTQLEVILPYFLHYANEEQYP